MAACYWNIWKYKIWHPPWTRKVEKGIHHEHLKEVIHFKQVEEGIHHEYVNKEGILYEQLREGIHHEHMEKGIHHAQEEHVIHQKMEKRVSIMAFIMNKRKSASNMELKKRASIMNK